ncbi:MAG: hypothetical protein EBU07_07160 [Betaproteobacteria bacterium]|nr:hypothetical protein [Betaproteobacteria bacterium]
MATAPVATTPSAFAPAPSAEAPNCWRCVHFSITHLPATPYGCRAMGFRSRVLPHLEVIRVDGLPCQSYRAKPGPGAAPGMRSA